MLSQYFLLILYVMTAFSSALNNIGDFTSDIHLLDEDPFDIFNKTLAAKSTPRTYIDGVRVPPTVPVPYTSRYVHATSAPITGREAPSYPTPNHNSFTPPLPREFLSPFADKPTLRGSNSENSVSNRRPVPRPPPFAGVPPDGERIPIKPPDLQTPNSKKKSINTPSDGLPENVLNYSEPSSSTSTTRRTNDTFSIVIPAVHDISSKSILRLLDNAKNHDFLANKPRLDQELKPKLSKDEVLKNLSTTTIKSTSVVSPKAEEPEPPRDTFIFPQNNVIDVSLNQDNGKEQEMTEKKSELYQPPVVNQESTRLTPDKPERRTRYILGVFWEFHVYLIATLFVVVTSVSLISLFRCKVYKWILPRGYFITLHSLLLLIGTERCIYLLYDPYNIGKTLSDTVSRLLSNSAFPLLTTAFTLLFVFVIKAVDVKIGYHYVQKSYILLSFVIVYCVFAFVVYIYADLSSYSSVLLIISQCLLILISTFVSVTYIYLYKFVSRASLRKQPSSVYSGAFTDPLRISLSLIIRLLLATSLLFLLLSVMQLIGMFSIYEPLAKDTLHPWIWWGLQFSIRVVEVAACFLLSWAAIQSHSQDEKETNNSASGFALFAWGGTPRGSDNAEDMYPTICSANQAVNTYSLRTGKQVYEDVYPLNNIGGNSNFMSHTTDRRSVKRYPVDVENEIANTCGNLVSYMERRPQPSPSMLVDEKGIVRFKPFNEMEIQREEFQHGQLVNASDEYST